MENLDGISDLRTELRNVSEGWERSLGRLGDRLAGMEKEMTLRIHGVELTQARTDVLLTSLSRDFSERTRDLPSKSQVTWLMGVVAALIIAVVGSAYAILTHIPNQ